MGIGTQDSSPVSGSIEGVPHVKRVSVTVRNIIQAYLNLVDWKYIQEGDPQGDVKDWSTSSEFIQWKE